VKVVLQRVARAEVRVAGASVARIGLGMLVLACVEKGDDDAVAERLAQRVAHLRFFPDAAGKMNRAAGEVGGAVLLVSQFTLAADGRGGRRPSFGRAAAPEVAAPLLLRFGERLQALGLPVEHGIFGASMQIALVNDGPVTFVLEEPPEGG
jgi:D-tyrosyl-tRNA(Tyr) deacylase